MRRITTSTGVALAAILSATPLVAQQRINVCVIADGRVTEIAADYNPATGDTTVAGKRFGAVHPVGNQYAAGASWYIQNAPIAMNGVTFTKYGLPRVLGVTDVSRVGEFEGVPLFAEFGIGPKPEVLYVPVRPGCEFQPYAGDLSITDADPWPEINYSETVRGTLDEGDDIDYLDDSFVDTYRLLGKANETAIIELRSSDFDVYLSVEIDSSAGVEEIASNDDGFDSGTDARLVLNFSEDAVYYIRATSYFEDVTGDYTLSVSRGGSPSSQPAATLAVPGTVTGTLSTSDQPFGDGTYYDEYRIDAAAGQRVVLTLESDDFDTYLVVGEENGNGFDSLETNDDAEGMGTDSRIAVQFEKAGEYVVRVNSLFKGETGRYTLTITR